MEYRQLSPKLQLAEFMPEHSPLPEVLDRGVEGFRARAEAIIE